MSRVVALVPSQGSAFPHDGIYVYRRKDLPVASDLISVDVPAWAVPKAGGTATALDKLRRAATSPITARFYKPSADGKMQMLDAKSMSTAVVDMEKFCRPVASQMIYAYAITADNTPMVVTVPSSLFGQKPLVATEWIKAILAARVSFKQDDEKKAAAPPTPPQASSNKRKADASPPAAAAAERPSMDVKCDPSQFMFPIPFADTPSVVKVAGFIDRCSLGLNPECGSDIRRNAMTVARAADMTAEWINQQSVNAPLSPFDLFVHISNALMIKAQNFAPKSGGTTQQFRMFLALDDLEKKFPDTFEGFMLSVVSSRIDKGCLDVLTQVLTNRDVATRGRKDSLSRLVAFVDRARECFDDGYMHSLEAWQEQARKMLVSQDALYDPEGPAPSSSEVGVDPNATVHKECVKHQKDLIDAHAKISEELARMTAERDKLAVSLSVSGDVVAKLRSSSMAGSTSSSVPILESEVAKLKKENASLKHQLRTCRALATSSVVALQKITNEVDLT